MLRTTLAMFCSALILAGCATDKPSPDSKAAKEFATQWDKVCCYVAQKSIPDEGPAKIDWAAQVAELKSQLAAKESENADLKRQLDALKARPIPPDLSGENADLKRQLDALKARPIPPDLSGENADLKRQLDALKTRPTPPDLSSQLAAKESENADLRRQLAAMKEARDKQASELSRTLADKGSMTLHGILFDTGKATIKPQSAKDLAAIGQVLTNDPLLKVEIQGHTDNVGGDASNLQLSKRRAAAVKEYVVKYFVIEPDRLTTEGFGESKPVADNNTAEGRALNRRVELIKK